MADGENQDKGAPEGENAGNKPARLVVPPGHLAVLMNFILRAEPMVHMTVSEAKALLPVLGMFGAAARGESQIVIEGRDPADANHA